MLYEFNTSKPSEARRQPVYLPAQLGISEKHIEEFVASKLTEIIMENQLMLIGQERSFQEEADVYALDQSGRLYIFELKRWPANSENLLQVMRYGQKFGRYTYSQLDVMVKRMGKIKGDLKTAHQEHFELDAPLSENRFNHDQKFVVITNGVDADTLGAIRYWNDKGVAIESLTYRLYKIGGLAHIWFDVYNPAGDILGDENTAFYVVNSNGTAWKEMLDNQKAASYGPRRGAVSNIRKGAFIYLYHNGVGFIAKGKATGDADMSDDWEFSVPTKWEWQHDPNTERERIVSAREFNERLGSGQKFRRTVFGISEDVSKVIDELHAGKACVSV